MSDNIPNAIEWQHYQYCVPKIKSMYKCSEMTAIKCYMALLEHCDKTGEDPRDIITRGRDRLG